MARRKLVTPASQLQKNTVHGFFNLNPMDEVETVSENGKPPLLHCERCLYNFTKKIKELQMDDREWELLRATPFGRLTESILEIDMNVEMLDSLLRFWDEDHCGFVIGGSTVPFTVDDIALITGLPNRGLKVQQKKMSSFKFDPEFNRIHTSTTRIEKSLDFVLQNSRASPNSETNKRFVQKMILYLWGCVLFPSSCRIVPKYLSFYVHNLEAIGNFNWAEYLHFTLVKEINLKSKLLKLQYEKKVDASLYIKGAWFAINVWFFEHVDFGEDSRPSNPDVRPRMLKWVGCKMWQGNPFLQRFREIFEDKISYRIIPKNDELELVSLENVDYMAYQIFQGSGDAVRGDPSQLQTTENMGSDIKAGCEEACLRGRESEEEKKLRNYNYSELKQYISVLVGRVARLERLAASKGWEIKEMNGMDDLCEHKDGEVDEKAHDGKIDGEVNEQVVCHLNEAFQEPCIEGDVGLTVERVVQPNLIEINVKQGYRKHVKRKDLKSLIVKEHLVTKRRRDVEKVQTPIPSMRSLISSGRKGADILVNLDDYASPSEQKKLEANVAPLNYVGRELLTNKERKYLDDFCIKPMQRDDIVFFNWNIAIRRHSMVGYLQGGYTGEEIIDAYARSLFNKDNMSGDNFASFLYVPPMFLGLYRNKLSSYKTFLNLVDKNSLKLVKFLLLPCLISTANHWLLLVCDLEMRKWTAYDSLYDPRHRGSAKEQIMLLEEYLYQDHGFDIRLWGLDYRRIYPQQEPGTLDCGIFVMKFIENIIHVSRKISFRGTDMKLFRPQIAYKILCHC